MTEIPEHLLRRSRERREALGLTKPGEAGAPTPAAAESGGGEVEKAAAATPAAATPAFTPAPAPTPAPPPPPKPLPPYVQAAKRRKRIPFWAMPVLAALPVWAFIYAFTLAPPSRGAGDPLVLGQTLFEGNCASCHGAQGQGGVGPKLADGEMQANWPDYKEHIEWVKLGSAKWPDATYGAEKRPKKGGMPTWEDQLSEDQITLIVRYEREVLSGGEPEPELVALTEQIAATMGGGAHGGGH